MTADYSPLTSTSQSQLNNLPGFPPASEFKLGNFLSGLPTIRGQYGYAAANLTNRASGLWSNATALGSSNTSVFALDSNGLQSILGTTAAQNNTAYWVDSSVYGTCEADNLPHLFIKFSVLDVLEERLFIGFCNTSNNTIPSVSADTPTNPTATTITAAGGRTLTFAATAGYTITASSGNFSSDGYIVGAPIVVAGTTSNNGTFTILRVVSATVLVVDGPLVAEGPLSATATLNSTLIFREVGLTFSTSRPDTYYQWVEHNDSSETLTSTGVIPSVSTILYLEIDLSSVDSFTMNLYDVSGNVLSSRTVTSSPFADNTPLNTVFAIRNLGTTDWKQLSWYQGSVFLRIPGP